MNILRNDRSTPNELAFAHWQLTQEVNAVGRAVHYATTRAWQAGEVEWWVRDHDFDDSLPEGLP